ncbi:invasin [Shewanella sp. 0m-4]
MKSAYSIFIAFIWSFILVGCSGGGSISEDEDGGTTPDPTAISIELNTTNSLISVAENATITAKVTDSNGAPVSTLVSFSLNNATYGVFTPGTGEVSTDSEGIASIDLRAGSINTGATVTASISSGESETLQVTMIGDGTAIEPFELSLTVVDSTKQELREISQSTPGTVIVTLTQEDKPVKFSVIEFTIEGEGIINPSSGTALTNSSGEARIDIISGTVKGAGKVIAKYKSNDDIVSDNYSYSVIGDAPGGDGEENTIAISLTDNISGNQTSGISSENPGRINITLTDKDGAPIKGKVVRFASTLGIFLPNIGTALTDNLGSASIILSAGSIEGAGEVTASYGDTFAVIGFQTAGDEIDPVEASPEISFNIYNCNGITAWDKTLKNFEVCVVTDNINNDNPGIIGATVTRSGTTQALQQVLVTAATTLGGVSPASGTAITNADGKAVLDLYANGDVGAGELTLKVKDIISTKAFEIGRVDISLDVSTYVGSGVLPAGGSTVIEVKVKNSSGKLETSQPFTLELTSQCMAAGRAVIDSPVVTNAGKGFATYRSINCEGTDTVTVSAITGASSVSATSDISVNPVSVGAIEFVSAIPSELAIKVSGGLSGAGSRSETSKVSFRLLNEVGQAAGSELVCFELSTDVGGITLSPSPSAVDYIKCANFPKPGEPEYPTNISALNKYAVAYSDANGDISVTVNSGTIATPVKVFAVWQDRENTDSPIVANVSDGLTVTTGLADYNSFSLSSTVLNLEGWEHDGETTSITIRSSDHSNNPVPAGTSIVFTTEGGDIGGNCLTVDKTGTCSVGWESQNPRPFEGVTVTCPAEFNGSSIPPCIGTTLAGYLNGTESIIPEPRPGRSTVTAYAIGEESFVDLNGNGQYDFGEPWTDISEAFTDDNEDDVYRGSPVPVGAVEEEFIDYNNDGTFSDKDGFYTGILCAATSASNCTQTGIDNAQAQLNVFRNMTLVMSGSTPYGRLVDIDDAGNITPVSEIDLTIQMVDDDNDPGTPDVDVGLSSKTVYLFVSDLNNNTLSNGTTISAETDNGVLASSTQAYTIGNNSSNKPLLYQFTLGREGTPNQKTSGLLSITVQTKYGDPVIYSVNVKDNG